MKALIDGDILRYEVGFAAEAAARHHANDEDALPSWDLVQSILHQRIDTILEETESDSYCLYLSRGVSFRERVASTKPYKGHRVVNKPFHFTNISVYIHYHLPHKYSMFGLEADDMLAIDQTNDTVICSRDKDLLQVPGWAYSWELGHQPRFGPAYLNYAGSLRLSKDRKSIKGSGVSLFYAQLLIGDKADNIPGLKGCGPVAAYTALKDKTPEEMHAAVYTMYKCTYGAFADAHLDEQGKLLFLIRRIEDGVPVHWTFGDELKSEYGGPR